MDINKGDGNLKDYSENYGNKKKKNADGFTLSKKAKRAICVVACVLLSLSLFFSGYFVKYFSIDERLRSLDFVLRIYDEHYCSLNGEYPDDIAVTKTLANAFIGEYADRYSEYFSPDDKASEDKSSNGEMVGVGIGFLNDFTLYSVRGNSPAERAGVAEGGKVSAYKSDESEWISAKNEEGAYDAFVDFIKQIPKGSKLYLKVKYSEEEEREYAIEKNSYNQTYVYYADAGGFYGFSDEDGEMKLRKTGDEAFGVSVSEFTADTGYIRLTQFSGLKSGLLGGSGQFVAALGQFKSQNRTKLILDLRGNGGGFVSIMSEIARYLCPTASGGAFKCMAAVDKNGSRDETKTSGASKYSEYRFKKIIVLCDGGTASASEALIGAMLDYDELCEKRIVSVIVAPTAEVIDGVEVATYKTYGKGIMQSTYTNVLTGEAVKFTTAVIRWPLSNVCIHGVGITSALNQTLGRPAVIEGGSTLKGDLHAALDLIALG